LLTKYGRRTALSLGLPLLGGTVLIAWHYPPAGLITLVPALFTFSFFRDPRRETAGGENHVVAPADGKVVEVGTVEKAPLLDAPAHKVGIFMSIFNAHVNRLPLEGKLLAVQKNPGKFLNALKAASARENENVTTLWERSDGLRFVVRQIAGVIARTVVCEPRPGAVVQRGEAFGMIKFGSRTELYLPVSSEFKAEVKTGQAVRAGSTILGKVKA